MSATPIEAIDARVLDHMVREDVPVQVCGCESRDNGGRWFLCRYHDGMDAGLAIAADEVERLRAELDAVRVQTDRPVPELPDHWGVGEQHGYRQGWQDAMSHVTLAIATAHAADLIDGSDR